MLNNVALIYRKTGRQKAAEPYYLHALEIYEKQLGPEHPDVASVLNNLASSTPTNAALTKRRRRICARSRFARKSIRRPSRYRAIEVQSRRRLSFRRRLCAGRRALPRLDQELGRGDGKPPEDYEIVASNYADLLRSLGKARKANELEERARGRSGARGR